MIRMLHEQTKRAEVLVAGAFFAMLFFGLFLGDGKQGVIEVFSGSIALVCWGLFRLKNRISKRLPFLLSFGWAAFVLVAYVSLLRSDSIGFSLSWFIRLFSSYILYIIFYSLASKTTTMVFIVGACALTVGAGLLSVVSASSPLVRDLLPSMNLIDTRYGHSHLADLLVFVTPAILYWVYTHRSAVYAKWLVAVLYCSALFFTYARGAWIVIGVYCLFWLAATRSMGKKTAALFLSIGLLGVIAVVLGMKYLPSHSNHILRQLTRPATVSSRLEYWRQAQEAFKERPLFGSGPGTFSLESQRFQKTTGQSSWFAHSLPIQTLAETGVVGLGALFFLVGVHFVRIFQTKRPLMKEPLGVVVFGCTLVLGYGVFEFVLDYQIMWLLFWSGIGLFTGLSQVHQHDADTEQPMFIFSLTYVVAFYILWMCSSLSSVIGLSPSITYLLAPHDAGNALMALTKTTSPQPRGFVSEVANFFHAKNPNILIEISKAKRALGDVDGANISIYTAAHAFPTLENVQKEYVTVLLEAKKYDAIGLWLRESSPVLFYSNAPYRKSDIDLSPEVVERVSRYIPLLFDPIVSPSVRYSRFFYNAGLEYLSIRPQKTAALWLLANRLQPSLSYIWVERAALEKHVLFNEQGADMILDACKTEEFARKHCAWILQTGTIPKVGSHGAKINEK